MTTTLSWRKRSLDDDHHPLDKLDTKRPKFYYYYILQSESPPCSDDDTESVYSLQDKTTDIARDTSDTDSKTETEFEVEIEYEVASLPSDSDQDTCSVTSSEPEDIMLAAAAICDSSLEAFITDVEDSDNSLQDEVASALLDFRTCIQCKSRNNNPQYRYCDKCYQDRKTTFPVRPRRFKKSIKNNKALLQSPSSSTASITTTATASASSTTSLQRSTSPVKLAALKSCLSSLSQDSGLGSSTELPTLCLDEIYVPSTSSQQQNEQKQQDLNNSKNRKRQLSESSLSDYELPQSTKKTKQIQDDIIVNHLVTDTKTSNLNECKEMCIICQNGPKNSAFSHGRIAHMCCCYKCAMRTWKSSKRCPICNRRVHNVVRVFTS